ncbi:GyrI-like domain-containing protein [Lactiplantibacillus herbarum]|uniref:GyrI-like domain-containing protein n=1 Tax=Lactiplantibacillus herbarum TaxID=1670446 RepID=UPI00064F1C47|nr:GyrI-like domain-containing protein [Lactiplantibacillus herbarum]
MANYEIITKPTFTVLGIGTVLTGDYQTLPAQKQSFWQQTTTNDQYTQLVTQAQNSLKFAVNEAVNGEMRYYAGVQVANSAISTGQLRAIVFPDSDYLVVRGQAATDLELFAQLEGATFGEVLPQLTDQAYVGGPNTTVITSHTADQVQGEMWVPVTAK